MNLNRFQHNIQATYSNEATSDSWSLSELVLIQMLIYALYADSQNTT